VDFAEAGLPAMLLRPPTELAGEESYLELEPEKRG
jgi:hypothetical protein